MGKKWAYGFTKAGREETERRLAQEQAHEVDPLESIREGMKEINERMKRNPKRYL